MVHVSFCAPVKIVLPCSCKVITVSLFRENDRFYDMQDQKKKKAHFSSSWSYSSRSGERSLCCQML